MVNNSMYGLVWIKDYEGLYAIDTEGNVYSRHKGRFFIISQFLGGSGDMYYKVNLSKNGVCKKYYVHRLLAEAFIPRVEGKDCVNHIDGNRRNNDLSNLEWCTPQENTRHYWTMRQNKEKSEIEKTTGCVVF